MPVLTFGALTIDVEQAVVRLGGEAVPITFQEFKLLVGLATRTGRVISRQELIAHAWPPGEPISPRTVDVHIRRLRHKLHDHCHQMIETVYQRGYRLATTPSVVRGKGCVQSHARAPILC